MFNALWGKLAAEIVMATDAQDWAAAVEDARALREAIEARASTGKTPLSQQVQHRAWFLHWAVFLAFTSPAGRTLFVDCAFPQSSHEGKYYGAMLLVAPWLLRYVCVAAVSAAKQPVTGILGQSGLLRRSPTLRELTRVIDSEAASSSSVVVNDPVVGFLRALFVDFNLSAAAAALKSCRDVVFPNDFHLHHSAVQREFFTAARALLLDTAARTTSTVEVAALLESLGLTDIVPPAAAAAGAAAGAAATDAAATLASAEVEPAVSSNASLLAAGSSGAPAVAGGAAAGAEMPVAMVSPAISRCGSVHQQVMDRARGVINKTNGMITAMQKKSGAGKDN